MLILLSPCSLTALESNPRSCSLLGGDSLESLRLHCPTQHQDISPDTARQTQDTASLSLQLDCHRSPDNGACSTILCCLNTRGFLSHKFLFDCHVQHKNVLFWSDLSERGGGGGNDQTQDNDIFPFQNFKGRLMKKFFTKEKFSIISSPPLNHLFKTYVQLSCLGLVVYSHILPATRIYSSSLYPFMSLHLTLSSQFFPMIMLYKLIHFLEYALIVLWIDSDGTLCDLYVTMIKLNHDSKDA